MRSRILIALTSAAVALSAPTFAQQGQPPQPPGTHQPAPQKGHVKNPPKAPAPMLQPCGPGQGKSGGACATPPAPHKPGATAGHDPHKKPPQHAGKPAPKGPKFKKGEGIKSDAQWLRNPERYRGLDRNKSYWRHDDYVYQVDPKTGKVLAVIGALQALSR